jgi:hypothetical protein
MAIQPNGGSQAFGQNARIEVTLPQRPGLYIDPASLHIRYTFEFTNSALADIVIMGCPAYSPFATLTERINSMNIASLNQFGPTAHRYIKSNLNVADQYGLQTAFGYFNSANTTTNDVPSSLDGYFRSAVPASTTTSLSLSAPLAGLSAIANCDHLIPTALLGQIQFDFTTEALSNFMNASTGTLSCAVKNFEVCFLAVDMGEETDRIVASMAPKIYLKTNAWASNGQPLANSTGQQTLNYVMRYASVEKALLGFYKSNAPNLAFDAVDITNNNGSYQFQLASRSYPQVPFNTANNKAGVLQELRRCFGSIGDWRHSPSINSTEFNSIVATGTTASLPGAFYIPYRFSKVCSTNPYQELALLSGVSTANTGINVVVSCSSAPGASTTGLLCVNYTMLLEVDTASRTFSIIQ